ncbi:hypothetical protein [Deinococcus sp.]|uniref:hypothetical protein n=1 Tax=Deinococcus sp. TaxID=47478 RepID=UPI0025BBD463|nr:hypothetical protein [Deinococcus sp.]
MRRLLTLLLATLGATLGMAHAAYCFDVPGEDRTLLPRFQGSPRQVTEIRSETNPGTPDAPPRTTRTFTFQGGRLTQIETQAPGDQTRTLLTLTGRAGYQRAWVGLEGALSGSPCHARAGAQAAAPAGHADLRPAGTADG